MTNEELARIKARAEVGVQLLNDSGDCDSAGLMADVDRDALLAEIERLRGLIKDLPEVARELCERPGNEDAFLVDIGDRVAEGLREHIDESGDVR